MVFSYGSGGQGIDGNNKCREITGNFDCHGQAHIQGFTQSHWTPPSSKCLRCIAPAAAMVDKFE